jgi:competence protein ComEA
MLTISGLFASVDINNASAEELMGLSGVGAKKSHAIVAFRKGHCFKNVRELTLVKGIGKKTLEKNKNNLTAGACK